MTFQGYPRVIERFGSSLNYLNTITEEWVRYGVGFSLPPVREVKARSRPSSTARERLCPESILSLLVRAIDFPLSNVDSFQVVTPLNCPGISSSLTYRRRVRILKTILIFNIETIELSELSQFLLAYLQNFNSCSFDPRRIDF
jgi:hypothetical protein